MGISGYEREVFFFFTKYGGYKIGYLWVRKLQTEDY